MRAAPSFSRSPVLAALREGGAREPSLEGERGPTAPLLRTDPHFFLFILLQVLTYHVISCDHLCDPLSK